MSGEAKPDWKGGELLFTGGTDWALVSLLTMTEELLCFRGNPLVFATRPLHDHPAHQSGRWAQIGRGGGKKKTDAEKKV